MPPESHESDPFNTRPSLPVGNLQTNWPGLDISTPYPAYVDSRPPPPPVGNIVLIPEKRRWLHSTQAMAIGLLSLAVVILSLVVLSFHQGGIVGFFSNSTSSNSSSTTNVQNTSSSNHPPGSTNPSSGNNPSTPQRNPAAIATVATIAPSATNIPTSSTPTLVVPTATSTSVPALTVTFTCQNAGGGKGASAQVCVHTAPGAQVTITATKCDGTPDDNLKQNSGTTDSAGNIQWSWDMKDPGPCKLEHVTVTAQAISGQTAQNALDLQFTH